MNKFPFPLLKRRKHAFFSSLLSSPKRRRRRRMKRKWKKIDAFPSFLSPKRRRIKKENKKTKNTLASSPLFIFPFSLLKKGKKKEEGGYIPFSIFSKRKKEERRLVNSKVPKCQFQSSKVSNWHFSLRNAVFSLFSSKKEKKKEILILKKCNIFENGKKWGGERAERIFDWIKIVHFYPCFWGFFDWFFSSYLSFILISEPIQTWSQGRRFWKTGGNTYERNFSDFMLVRTLHDARAFSHRSQNAVRKLLRFRGSYGYDAVCGTVSRQQCLPGCPARLLSLRSCCFSYKKESVRSRKRMSRLSLKSLTDGGRFFCSRCFCLIVFSHTQFRTSIYFFFGERK